MTLHTHTTLSNTTATRLSPNGVHSGMDITIQNIHESAYVYVGGEDVSASVYGYRIAPGAAFLLNYLVKMHFMQFQMLTVQRLQFYRLA
jgi:hypothetical protein